MAPQPQEEKWIASRSLSSGAHSRDPLARNDGITRIGAKSHHINPLLTIHRAKIAE
jgi:hypothetical protein